MKSMVLICFLAALTAASIAAMLRRVRFTLMLDRLIIRIRAELVLPGALPFIRLDVCALLPQRAVFLNGRRIGLRRGGRRRKLPAKEVLHLIKGLGVIESLTVKGGIGVREDAGLSVVLTGALRELLRAAVPALNVRSSEIVLCPAFDRDEFCIILEGIARLHPAQIICAALRLSGRRMGSDKRSERRRRDTILTGGAHDTSR